MNNEKIVYTYKGNQMELKEMIKVMQHYENGVEVECTETAFDDWEDFKVIGVEE